MEHGYYWLQLQGKDPEIVEIDYIFMYRCGSDVLCLLEDEKWLQHGDLMDIVSLIGPISPPSKTRDTNMTFEEWARARAKE